ncbi:MAG: hypothetical protein GXO77_02215 [Calditrichaeota bacterium]|nr:hypothetical protein [Calditrichota bacterium]
MAKQFVYFYFMKNMPKKIKEVVPMHVSYWKSQKLNNYYGGPFADRTGGLITFEAGDIASASEVAENDPFIRHDLIENKWVKEWIVE